MTRTEFLGLTKREPNDKYNLAENNENLDRIDLFAQTIATGIVGIPVEETGVSISLTDASNNNLKNLVVYGKTTQNVTPTPTAPVDLESVVNPTVTISTYEPYKSQTLSVPYTLNGVGDVKDYVDFERGVLVRKCNEKIFSGGTRVTRDRDGLYYMQLNDASKTLGLSILCNRYRGVSVRHEALNNNQISLYQDTYNTYPNQNWIYVRNNNCTTAEELAQSLVENPITVIYPLAKPTETPLTAEELEAFKTLHSYYPTTTITNSENAEMGVEYFADTKIYIDNKFAELNRAILNNI